MRRALAILMRNPLSVLGVMLIAIVALLVLLLSTTN